MHDRIDAELGRLRKAEQLVRDGRPAIMEDVANAARQVIRLDENPYAVIVALLDAAAATVLSSIPAPRQRDTAEAAARLLLERFHAGRP